VRVPKSTASLVREGEGVQQDAHPLTHSRKAMSRLHPDAIASTLPRWAGGDDPFQLPPPPIINGVPKLLFDDDEVAAMFGISVSTVRNRYNPESKWFDPNFPVPRHTGGGEKGRKAAVRWYWDDLARYALNLPRVPFGHTTYKPVRPQKPNTYGSNAGTSTSDSSSKPFDI